MCYKGISIFILIILPAIVIAQSGVSTNGGSYLRSIPTGVPFLNITPDSRSGALGEAGVALSPDANANFWNPSKLAFIESDNEVSASYNPWLRHLVPDVSLSYLSYAHKLDDRNAIGASLRYFNLGSIQLVDASQNNQGIYRPSEYSLDFSFARKFGEEFSLGLTGRYIRSDLSNQSFAIGSSQQTKAGNAAAVDVSLFYRKPIQEFGSDASFAFGANISNIGTKIGYANYGSQFFLPANLKIGVANMINIDSVNAITFAFDINKLLVPAPTRDANGNNIAGSTDNISVPAGIFGSFTDAPGGFKEELQQITLSPGIEYWYNKQFAVRAGYFYGNANEGNNQYLTLGVGLKYNIYNFDFSYVAASQQNSPLANTLRLSLSANFGRSK